jgi:uncharacterized protein (DUF983 family)
MAQSNLVTGLKRGILGRCPNCGQGPLLRAYLKVVPTCAVCGHDNGQYPADDAPPYFTILIVGHLVVAPALCFSFIWTWPVAWVLAVTLPAIMAATLLLLPRVKGAVIGAQWAIRQNDGAVPGAEESPAWTPHDARS